MSKSDPVELQRLAELESEWNQLLRRCLEECARGRLGLFANNAEWPEAERARSLAQKIAALHGSLGSANPVCELFLHYCSLRHGPNVRGEPRMAAEFLEELKDLGEIR